MNNKRKNLTLVHNKNMAMNGGDEGLFDPFWVLFRDEESDEEIDLRTSSRNDKQATLASRNEGSGMLNYFMPEENYRENAREERQPSAARKKEQKKIQHYWRRNKDSGRLSFGRRSISSKKNSTPSSSNSLSSWTSPERRETVHEQERGHDDSCSVEENNQVFPSMELPSFTEAFSNPWDPWGEQSSTSGSSEASYISDETDDDESLASFASVGSASFETQEQPQVDQIVVQFNPMTESMNRNMRSQEEAVDPNGEQGGFLTDITSPEGSHPRDSSADQPFLGNEERTINSLKKITFDQEFKTSIDFDVIDEERKSSRCMTLQNVCGTQGKKLEGNFRLPFCRRNKIHDANRDLTSSFPKLRMVADEKEVGLNSLAVVSNSRKFRGNVPAHLQLSSDAFLAARGPQSLYEYEYDGGEHIDVAYNHFGPNPLSLLVIRHHERSPRLRPNGAIVQVEVSSTAKRNTHTDLVVGNAIKINQLTNNVFLSLPLFFVLDRPPQFRVQIAV